MNPKIALGFVLAVAIGALSRLAGLPVPAPPTLIGALLVVAMTVGYLITGRIARHREAQHQHLSGGPTGGVRNLSAEDKK